VGADVIVANPRQIDTDPNLAFPGDPDPIIYFIADPDPTLISADLEPAFYADTDLHYCDANLQHRPLDHPRLQGTSSVLFCLMRIRTL
jgi:hypothetical protein